VHLSSSLASFASHENKVIRFARIGEGHSRPLEVTASHWCLGPLRSMKGDFEALYAGRGAGHIQSIVSARERLEEIVKEADAIIGA